MWLPFEKYYQAFELQARRYDHVALERLPHGGLAARIGGEAPYLAIVGGLHGDETSGPLALLEWISNLQRVKLPAGRSIWVLPLVNDEGWDAGRRNWGEHDLNRSFIPGDSAPAFVSAVMRRWQADRPLMLLDLHEDGTQADDPYLFQYAHDTHDLSPRLAECLGARLEAWDDFEPWHGSDETFLRSLGVPHCVTVEAPADWPLERRIAWNIRAVECCVDYLAQIPTDD